MRHQHTGQLQSLENEAFINLEALNKTFTLLIWPSRGPRMEHRGRANVTIDQSDRVESNMAAWLRSERSECSQDIGQTRAQLVNL